MHQLFLKPLVDCISTDRAPTLEELMIVTERIWDEGLASCSFGDLGQARLMAEAALRGNTKACPRHMPRLARG